MRTIAIRVEDELHSQLTLLAKLAEHPLVEEIRQAIDEHIARRSEEVDLTAQAQIALEEIDKDAAGKRQAIQSLLSGQGGKSRGKSGAKGGAK